MALSEGTESKLQCGTTGFYTGNLSIVFNMLFEISFSIFSMTNSNSIWNTSISGVKLSWTTLYSVAKMNQFSGFESRDHPVIWDVERFTAPADNIRERICI